MVAWGLILLVAHVLLFIEDNQPRIVHRSKESRPCADDNSDALLPDPPHGVRALRHRQPAVKDDDISGKKLLEAGYKLTGKSYLRHQYDCLTTCPAAPGHRFDIDPRLAAAGYAI